VALGFWQTIKDGSVVAAIRAAALQLIFSKGALFSIHVFFNLMSIDIVKLSAGHLTKCPDNFNIFSS